LKHKLYSRFLKLHKFMLSDTLLCFDMLRLINMLDCDCAVDTDTCQDYGERAVSAEPTCCIS